MAVTSALTSDGAHGAVGARSRRAELDVLTEMRSAEWVVAAGHFTTSDEATDRIVYPAGARTGNVTGSDFTIDGGLIKTP